MKSSSRDGPFDSTLRFLSNPYDYIGRRSAELGTDLFEARIMLRRTVCMTGPECSRIFYDNSRFQREGAAPDPVQATLFGKGGVQALDGAMHAQRKAMFLQILSPENVSSLAHTFNAHLNTSATTWAPGSAIPLYQTCHRLLAEAVCEWAGVPLSATDAELRTKQIVSLFDDAAKSLPSHLRARTARRAAENWLTELIIQAREQKDGLPPGCALQTILEHRDANGRLLEPRTAAVELLNILRPPVAISVYIVFATHAMHVQPGLREELLKGDEPYFQGFLQEVRRYYPFFPVLAARVREDFEWKGMQFKRGERAILDIYGTNHDERVWEAPHEFNPGRFVLQEPGPYQFIPQGGGDASSGHRCPGEGATLALMQVAIEFLLRRLSYTLSIQDESVNKKRMPALPSDPMVLRLGDHHTA